MITKGPPRSVPQELVNIKVSGLVDGARAADSILCLQRPLTGQTLEASGALESSAAPRRPGQDPCWASGGLPDVKCSHS